MILTTCLLPSHDGGERGISSDAEVAVVIDVLRATSVMATALHAGATEILTCPDVDKAFSLANSLDPRPLLCGERGCKAIDGFDLGNSPAEYAAERVGGKNLILTTTNGTRAIASVEHVPRVVAASFLNLSAVLDSLRHDARVHLICAGTDGRITLEDVLLAGAIIWKCQTDRNAQFGDDDTVLALQLWSSWFPADVTAGRFPSSPELSRRFRDTGGGRNLIRLGFDADLDRCAAIDQVVAVPQRVATSPTVFVLEA